MHRFVLVGAVLALTAASSAASAQVAVTLGSSAKSCFEAAQGARSDTESERLCTLAIDHEALSQRDLAGTYVNRGSIKFYRGDFDGAQQDFEQAIDLAPTLGETYVNRGAALQRMGLYAEAVSEIDRGLALQPSNPAQAYFNRGIAMFKLDDIKGAYFDFKKAAELAPDWDQPKLQLEQFTVEVR